MVSTSLTDTVMANVEVIPGLRLQAEEGADPVFWLFERWKVRTMLVTALVAIASPDLFIFR
jgi:hypothetical protein